MTMVDTQKNQENETMESIGLEKPEIDFRPKYFDDNVIELTVDLLLPEVLDWMKRSNDGAEQDEHTIGEIKRDLVNAISYEDDGYKIVRDLESDGWMVDRDLIDVMDGVANLKFRALDTVTEGWVNRNGIKPKFAPGKEVIFMRKNVACRGEIVAVDEKHAKYSVFCEKLGHVRKGVGVHACILPYEEVEEVK